MTQFITHTIEPWMPQGALKAKADYATIAVQASWQILSLYRYNDSRFDQTTRVNHINDWLSPVKSDDIVLHQFPTYMSAEFESDFAIALRHRGVQSAILIHDIEPLRLIKKAPWEFDVLNQYDMVIVHSQAMQDALITLGVHTQFIIQNFFDYLSDYSLPAQFSHKVNFAGTFQKSPWLQNYHGPEITVFGSKPKKWRDVTFPPAINYQGNFNPEDIVHQFQDGFGLIWDSDFDDKTYQSYTKYNTPHKASLYLRAGLPLIAWSNSALGKQIIALNLGFVLDHLDDLADQLNKVDEAQYHIWQTNALKMTDKLGSGYYTKETLANITM